MRTLKIIVSCIALLITMACRLGPDYKRPLFFDNALLEQTLNLKTPAVKTLPFRPEELKDVVLNKLIQETINNAPDIKAARARVESARAMRLSLIGEILPAFDVVEQYSDNKTGKNMPPGTSGKVYEAGLSIAWEIDLFGKKQRAIEAASAQEQQMIAALENVMVSLITEVGSAYVGLRTTQYLLEQTKEDLKIQEALANLTHDKYKSGLSNAIDVNQADYQVATTKAVIPKLETEIETYQNALAVLMGKPAGSLHNQLKTTKNNLITRPFTFSLDKLYEMPVEIIRLRPDVQGMEATLKAQNAEIGVALANMFPSISFSALFGFKSMKLPNLMEKESFARSYQPTVNVPLFHFGSLWQNVKAQEATKESLMAEYEKTILKATEEIRNSLVGLKKMEGRHKELERAWQKMDKAARLARNKYESGLIDYLQVLDAEERRIAAQAAFTTSCGNLYQNVLNFYKAVGGQFSFNKLENETK